MTEQPGENIPTPSRSKRIYVYWGVALALLLTAGLFCWKVVVPVWQVRTAVCPEKRVEKEFAPLVPPDGLWAPEVAVTRLGGPEKAVGKLSLYLHMPDFATTRRGRATEALGWCGRAAVPRLISCLRDDHENVRWEAVRALGTIGDPRAVTALRAASQDDACQSVRQAALEALKMIRAAEKKAVSDVPIYSSSNLSGHAVAPEWLGGDKATEQDVEIRSLKTHGEVVSNPKRRNVYVNAIGHKKFVERFPSGKPLRLGRYRYTAHVQLPLSPKPDLKQKTNPQAVHTMIQFWDGRNALYKSNKTTLEGAIYWDINPWTTKEFGKIKVYTHPVKLVDTGIRLRPDTSWHRFELVIDLKAQRYVSITIDDQTRDLSNMRLAQVKHSDWGRDVALIITTESLASWSKDAGAAFTWMTRFRDISFFENRPVSSDLPNQRDSGDADVR